MGQNMKTRIHVLVALAACIGLLLIGSSAGLLKSSVTLSTSGVVQQTSTGAYSYIISASGSNYQRTDGTTGQIVFQSTNATQVVNDAIGNLTQGHSILFSGGTYNLNGSITGTNRNNITLTFENGASLFVANGMDAPAIFLSSCNNWLISGITINGNGANQVIPGSLIQYPNGITLEASSNIQIANALIYDVRVYGVEIIAQSGQSVHSGVVSSKFLSCGWSGIELGGSNSASELSLYAINNEVAYCGDVGIDNYGIGNIVTGNYVHDMNGTTGSVNSHWGIGVEGGRADSISENTVQNCGTGIYIDQNNCTISDNQITNCNRTGHDVYGVYLDGISGSCIGNKVTDNYVTRVVGAYSSGIELDNATFNDIRGNHVSQCDYDGIFLDATSNNNTVSLNSVCDNVHVGIQICGSSNYVSQNQAFDDRSGSARTQNVGIAMSYTVATGYGNVLIGNNAYNNLFLNFDVGNNVPESTMINNTGYNPVGYIANPISGSTAYLVDSGSNTTWISGTVYTNTGSPKVLNISAGTVSVVAQNGVTLFTATGCTVTLQPGDTFSVTFSTAPTINVIGQ